MAKKTIDPGKKDIIKKTLDKGKSDTLMTKKGNMVTQKDLGAWKKSGLDFGTKEALGDYIDKLNIPKKAEVKDSISYGANVGAGKSRAKMSVEESTKVKEVLGGSNEADKLMKMTENSDKVRKILADLRNKKK